MVSFEALGRADLAGDGGQRRGAPSAARNRDVRAFVREWLDAQSTGDVRRFEALYAERCAAVVRMGGAIQNFGCARWLAERSGFVRRVPEVAADDVVIHEFARGARVHFSESTRAGGVRERTNKCLVLLDTESGLRIVREASHHGVLAPDPTLVPSDIQLIVHHGGHAEVVVDAHARQSWAAGPAELVSSDGVFVASKPASSLRLEGSGSIRGRAVELVGLSGPVCVGTVGELSLVARVRPHGTTRARWLSAPSVREVAEEVWSEAGDDGTLLVGRVVPTNPACGEARWARPPLNESFRALAPAPLDETVARQVAALFEKTAEYKFLQRGCATGTRWERKEAGAAHNAAFAFSDGQGTMTASGAATADGGATSRASSGVVVRTARGGASCTGAEGTLTQVFQWDRSGVVALSDPFGDEHAVMGMVDVDGDDGVDLVLADGVVFQRKTRFRTFLLLPEIPNHDGQP
jgi:hypothetical protein